jgi:hypothetical protein
MAIDPLNLTAQFSYRAQGNPPSTQPASAISNCFPGLEFDFRNIWKNLFEGVEMYEAGLGGNGHLVVDVAAGSPAASAGVEVFDRLISVDGRPVEQREILPSGPSEVSSVEFGNSLAHIMLKAGGEVPCIFQKENGTRVVASLTIRLIFAGAAVAEPLAEPGALTQSLCSPWQADYRECGCFYWAASRPDFVNAQPPQGGATIGHDWMQRGRTPADPYQADQGGFSPAHISYDDLYTAWEQNLKFIIGGKDAQ